MEQKLLSKAVLRCFGCRRHTIVSLGTDGRALHASQCLMQEQLPQNLHWGARYVHVPAALHMSYTLAAAYST